MSTPKANRLAVAAALFLAAQDTPADTSPVSGFYQIISGRYSECCGIAGNDFGYDLPALGQSYIKLTIDPQSGLASMTFLASDLQTVFGIAPCSSAGGIDFNFGYGFGYPGSTAFHVDPGPPPYGLFWSYTVSNSGPDLKINGVLGTAQSPCVDVPTRFGHSNVVAVLLPGPRLSLLGYSSKAGAQLMLQGHGGHTNVIEASTDLGTWSPVVTNVMDYSLCPICPYFLFQDPVADTNQPRRFYRAFEVW